MLNQPEYRPNFTGPAHRRRLAPKLAGTLEALIAKKDWRAILIAPLGNECLARFLVATEPPFTFHDLTSASPPDARPIPLQAFRSWLRELAGRNAGLFLCELRKRTRRSLLLVPPPPPIRSEETIRRGESPLHEWLAEARLNPAPLRQRIWKLYLEELSRLAAENSGMLLAPPADVFEAEGFLHPLCQRGDPTHANALYGELFWPVITEALARAESVDKPAGSSFMEAS